MNFINALIDMNEEIDKVGEGRKEKARVVE